MGTDGNDTTTCTVVGGRSSFVGRSLVAMLLKSPEWIVRIADSGPSLRLRPEEENNSMLSESVGIGRASYLQVDVRDRFQVSQAIKGSSVVFHMDVTDSSSQDFHQQYMFIVQGTKNVISACCECKVERLIYNSSADVVFDGIHDIYNGDESLKYPLRFNDMFNDLKAQAEAEVLSSNACDGLSTCSLRPCNPFGPGDEHLVPYLVEEAKSFRAKFFVGSDKMCDFTYVENVAHAHICAAQALCSRLPSVCGKPFFITNLEPMKMLEFGSLTLEGLGYQRPRICIPSRLALLCVTLVNWVPGKPDLYRKSHRYLNPAFISKLSCTRTFDSSKAQKLIGYSPIVSMEEGITSTVESFSHLAKESLDSRQIDFTRTSKADKLLGGGTVAEILLWRDERRTFVYSLCSFLFYYWFLLSGRTFVTSASKLLMLVSIMLFIHGKLPSSMFGVTIEKISSCYFEVPEASVRNTFICLAAVWNKCVCMLTPLSRGEDVNLFFKVAGSLYLFKLLFRFPLCVLIGVGLVSLFTAFIIYEQCEEEIDRLLTTSAFYFKKPKEILLRNLPAFVRQYADKNSCLL